MTTTDSNHRLPIAANELGRDFVAEAPNAKWSADITYVPTKEGWLYLAVILDLFSRSVVGWSMDDTMPTELTLRALRMALEKRQPGRGLLHHSDRGSKSCGPRLSQAPPGPWRRLKPVPQGQLLGQRRDRKFLWLAENGICSSRNF